MSLTSDFLDFERTFVKNKDQSYWSRVLYIVHNEFHWSPEQFLDYCEIPYLMELLAERERVLKEQEKELKRKK